ncbi:hypothetical protein DFP72DRAFT_821432 [Ephemerocybe angulata]|uniref:RecQ mediated genome instability protein 1 OB-fold domain-containing protein n=1 Tax=Ephemerocybe angulata TaxID=980116 RepID=A0A8H6HIX9_9AGAR|nr:hypothetical protein DFP72DRAFT_821432 [Tulosesus angulatus]
MPPTSDIQAWIDRTFPCPSLDPEWIEETCQFIEEEKFIFPFNSETEERFLNELEFAILHARLEDVMKKGTGLRAEITLPSMHTTLKGPVILELVHMTEVGVSAFALEKTRIDRDKVMHSHLYKAGQRGLEVGLVELMELDSKLPKYPRKSLKYWFTDGEMEIQAMEYKALPFTLGKVPIGIKVCTYQILGTGLNLRRLTPAGSLRECPYHWGCCIPRAG